MLPMVPLATNGTIGKSSYGTIGRIQNARSIALKRRIGTNVSTNGNIGTNATIGSRETFRVLWLPMVPLATNGSIGKISNGTIGRLPNARIVKIEEKLLEQNTHACVSSVIGDLTLLAQLVIDCSSRVIAQRLRITNSISRDVEILSRELCFALHLRRCSILKQLND